MKVILNGDKHDLPVGSTILSLLASLQLENAACAVEVNKQLVPKRLHRDKTLVEGDTVEVVTLVGGG